MLNPEKRKRSKLIKRIKKLNNSLNYVLWLLLYKFIAFCHNYTKEKGLFGVVYMGKPGWKKEGISCSA
jgi:hypothetical protein